MITARVRTAASPAQAFRREVLTEYRNHLGSGRALLAELVAAPVEVSAHGAIVRTSDDRELINCGGYAVFLLGHTHPAVVSAVSRQLNQNPLATRLLVEPVQAMAAKALCGIAPDGLRKVHFMGSGAEATELAIKLARANGRSRLISMNGGFHGKTTGALAVTPNERYQAPFYPLLESVAVPYGDLNGLDRQLSQVPGQGAVFVEPIQGEGGVIVPPEGYLRGVSDLCTKHGALLIVDEIQTGLGRCGKMWAHQPEIPGPDILLVGKALSGGVVPVAAVLATDEVFRPIGDDPTVHSSTFGGSPLACAAALATIETLLADRIPERAAEIGERLVTELNAVLEPWRGNLMREIRGRGLLIGIEFARPDVAGEVTMALLRNGVIVNHSLNNQSVMRLTPPAVLRRAEEERVIEAFRAVVGELSE